MFVHFLTIFQPFVKGWVGKSQKKCYTSIEFWTTTHGYPHHQNKYPVVANLWLG